MSNIAQMRKAIRGITYILEGLPVRIREPPCNESHNSILTIACVAIGAALGATGYVYLGIAIVVAPVIIASALKMANIWENSSLCAPVSCAASNDQGFS